jgi:hypothetical protein
MWSVVRGVGHRFNSWKIMSRHQNAHAYVNAAALISMEPDGKTVASACLTFGGLGPGLRIASNTAKVLVGKEFDSSTLAEALTALTAETVCTPPPATHPNVISSPAYREALCRNLVFKFFVEMQTSVPPQLQSVVGHYERAISSGTASFKPNPATAPLSEPITKLEAYSQCTGEAKYTDDIPQQPNELCAAYAVSTVASGVIASIDVSKALSMPGVKDVITAKDVTDMGCVNECGSFPGACLLCTVGCRALLCRCIVRWGQFIAHRTRLAGSLLPAQPSPHRRAHSRVLANCAHTLHICAAGRRRRDFCLQADILCGAGGGLGGGRLTPARPGCR